MQPVEPRTMVRGPAAFTIIFMTSALSQPWQVRWPLVKYSWMGSFFTPLNGSSFTGSPEWGSSASSPFQMDMFLPLFAQPDPVRGGMRLSGRGLFDSFRHLAHVGEQHLAATEAADEADDRRPLRQRRQRGAHFGGDHSARVRRAEREVAVDRAHRLEAAQRLR